MIDTIPDDVEVNVADTALWKEAYKQCALISVDEIMGLDFVDDVYLFKSTQTLKEYYQEVKSEIEKL